MPPKRLSANWRRKSNGWSGRGNVGRPMPNPSRISTGMAENQFAGMPTGTLARETLERARNLDDLLLKIWLRYIVAFAALSLPVCVLLFFTLDLRLLIAVSVVIGGPFVGWWICALYDAARYIKEMNARTAELKRRNREVGNV